MTRSTQHRILTPAVSALALAYWRLVEQRRDEGQYHWCGTDEFADLEANLREQRECRSALEQLPEDGNLLLWRGDLVAEEVLIRAEER